MIGFVGTFHPYEGLELLLAAMPALLRARPRCSCCWPAAARRRDWLKARAIGLRLGASVVFAGAAALERSAAFHALADVLVFPRLPRARPTLVPDGRLLEAMAHGCLVAASDVGGHRELVEHGRTGILFEAGNPDALADALAGAAGGAGQLAAAARRGALVHRVPAHLGDQRGTLCAGVPAPAGAAQAPLTRRASATASA